MKQNLKKWLETITLSHVKGFYFRLPGISYPIAWQISYILHVSVIFDCINIGVRIWLVSMVKPAPAGRCCNYTVVKENWRCILIFLASNI